MPVSMGTLVQSWSRPTLLTALGLLSLLHLALFFLALVFSPTLFHSAARAGSVCRVQDDGNAPADSAQDLSLAICDPFDAGTGQQHSGSILDVGIYNHAELT